MDFVIFTTRKQRDYKTTKTAPLSQSIMSQMLTLAESPCSEEFPGVEQRMEYFKSLTDSQTLERRPKNKPATPPATSPVCPRPVHPLNKLSRSVPDIQEPTVRTTKAKKPRGFTKIAILSSYFEQKIAELTGSGGLQKKGSPWRLFGRKKRRYLLPVCSRVCRYLVASLVSLGVRNEFYLRNILPRPPLSACASVCGQRMLLIYQSLLWKGVLYYPPCIIFM